MLNRAASRPVIDRIESRSGFTLLELIVGVVVLGIALLMISSILGPMYIRSSEPWQQVRAAELGHSLMNEILGKSFDEHSNRSGSLWRCGEAGAPEPATGKAEAEPNCNNSIPAASTTGC